MIFIDRAKDSLGHPVPLVVVKVFAGLEGEAEQHEELGPPEKIIFILKKKPISCIFLPYFYNIIILL